MDTYRFNPCYVGLGIRTLIDYSDIMPAACFNPCYVGLGIRTGTVISREESEALSFNPCYVGLGIRTD